MKKYSSEMHQYELADPVASIISALISAKICGQGAMGPPTSLSIPTVLAYQSFTVY